MKKIVRDIPMGSKIAILVTVLIITIALLFPRELTLQYLENGELRTESFKEIEDFNKRVMELQADSIKYWLD